MKLLPLACLVGLLLPTSARGEPDALEVAVQHFNDLDEAAAEASLVDYLKRNPPPAGRARAEVYLGLIRLNALKLDEARERFKAALRLVATVELPYGVSPKAHVVFDQARREFLEESAKNPMPSGASNARALEAMQAGPRERPSLVPPLVVLGTGVAALAVGIGFGVAEQQAQSASNLELRAAAATADHQTAASDSLAADVCFAAGGAAALAGAIWFLVAALSGGDTSGRPVVSVVPVRGGVTAGVSLDL